MLTDIVANFRTGKRVADDLFSDICRDMQYQEPLYDLSIHRTRYFGLIDDWKNSEMLGFICGLGAAYVRHPRLMHDFFNAREKE
jgi:hypothetical protein